MDIIDSMNTIATILEIDNLYIPYKQRADRLIQIYRNRGKINDNHHVKEIIISITQLITILDFFIGIEDKDINNIIEFYHTLNKNRKMSLVSLCILKGGDDSDLTYIKSTYHHDNDLLNKLSEFACRDNRYSYILLSNMNKDKIINILTTMGIDTDNYTTNNSMSYKKARHVFYDYDV